MGGILGNIYTFTNQGRKNSFKHIINIYIRGERCDIWRDIALKSHYERES